MIDVDEAKIDILLQSWVNSLPSSEWVKVDVRTRVGLRGVWLRVNCVAIVHPLGAAPEGNGIDVVVTTTAGGTFDVVVPASGLLAEESEGGAC